MLPLTERQLEVKTWIAKYTKSHNGMAPTLAEIAEGLGCNANNARFLVKQLKKRGHATSVSRMWRTVQLIPERAAT
jgi:SOS-response transcriptional repressor LexA